MITQGGWIYKFIQFNLIFKNVRISFMKICKIWNEPDIKCYLFASEP